jgi:hypothetical protein
MKVLSEHDPIELVMELPAGTNPRQISFKRGGA